MLPGPTLQGEKDDEKRMHSDVGSSQNSRQPQLPQCCTWFHLLLLLQD
jgi:hypothetical protein